MESSSVAAHELAAPCAEAIARGYGALNGRFAEITRRARTRFEQRDWHAGQMDSVERLNLYNEVVGQVTREVAALLGEHAQRKPLWTAVKGEYARHLGGRYDAEIAETFYNSVTRKFFPKVGVDPSMQFVDSEFESLLKRPEKAIFRTYSRREAGGTAALVEEILADLPFQVDYRDRSADTRLVAERIDAHLGGLPLDAVEAMRPVFYRGKGAYVIGRIRAENHTIPLLLALLNDEGGIYVDAVLLDRDEVSIVFSFTRSYFHVDAEKPREIVDFLRSVIPGKRLAELYISIGYNKHGKTELYREMIRHLAQSDDRFVTARGERGMVMMVFTLPSFDMVFKIIRDTFAYPKNTTRREVRAKYHLVFIHDRVGRLVDAQEFEHLKIHRSRFSKELLDELLQYCSYAVRLEGDEVVIKHLYVERRLRPLNLYLQEVDAESAREAVLDYGNAIKELVSAGIFPGDVMLKNFGVTRHGRVVFYDYDELCLITDCNFREIPQARDFNEELYAETYYAVGENDVFPEEFRTFLGLQGELGDIYVAAHGDLFGVAYWRERQVRLRGGEVVDVFPYKQIRHLRP